jgi:hypothetical protein
MLRVRYTYFFSSTQATPRRTECAEVRARRVLHGEQVGDDLPGEVVASDLLWGDVLGLDQHRCRLDDLTALGVRAGYVDEHVGAPPGRKR